MIKALLKKQFREYLCAFSINSKTGAARSSGAVVGYCILMAFCAVIFAVLFFSIGIVMSMSLHAAGADWVYFALMALIATVFGVIGSVFATQSQLYNAKDNDALLSMPIPAWQILFARMLGLYIQICIFEAIVLLPAAAAYMLTVRLSFAGGLSAVLSLLLLPLLGLTLTCLLGWLVALISSKFNNKSFVTVAFTVLFLGAYYFVYFQAEKLLEQIIANIDAVASGLKAALFPLYCMGRACSGSAVHLLLFAVLSAAPFALMYYILAKSFRKIATAAPATAKRAYRAAEACRAGTPHAALLKRELRHLGSNAVYITNAAMGTLFMVALTVAAVIKSGDVREFLTEMFGSSVAATASAAAIALTAGMNLLTACAVSLEGVSISLIRSLPVTPQQVLRAKLELHLMLTAAPAAICACVMSAALGAGVPGALAAVIFAFAISVLFGALDLMINLKMPYLNWTTEAVAVKQGGSSGVSMLVNTLITLVFGGGCVALGLLLPAPLVLFGASAVLIGADVLAVYWLKGRGSAIFASL